MAQRPSGWHRDKIKAALQTKCGPITRLSVTWGYPRSSITNCLLSPAYSRPLELKIAEALNVTPHELWPDRWDKRNDPLPRTRETKPATTVGTQSCQKAAAA